jgi:hypothetical protein
MRRSKPSTPRLDALMAEGRIKMLSNEWGDPDWILIAADGVELSFGLAAPIKMERYLAQFPTPDTW